MIPLATVAAYASTVVGTPVQIACEADAAFGASLSNIDQFPSGLDGYTMRGADGSMLRVLRIKQSVCSHAQAADRKQLRSPGGYVTFKGKRADLDTGPALIVILHEAYHVALQSSDEGQVECAAVSNIWQFVRQFKLPAFEARMDLAGAGWNHSRMPASYRTVC